MALIVVAEDDPGTLRLIEAALHLQGHSVLTSNNGHSAWLSIRQYKPDLVVSDINMPGVNGFDLLRAVREHGALNQTPFILLTSLQERRDMRHGMTLGADDYLTKPVHPRELADAVAAQLNRKAMRAAALELQVKEAVSEALDEQAWTLQEQYEQRLARELSEQWPGEAQGNREAFHPLATVLFADLRNDVEWVRALAPQQLATVLKRFYEGGGDTVHLFGAATAHFVGDGLLAMFTDRPGITTAHQGLRAVKAAFGLRNSASAMQAWLAQQFPGMRLPRFEVGIALHSGPVAMMRLDGLLGGTEQLLPVGETVVNALAMQRHTPGSHPVTVSIPVLRAVTGAVQPVSRHFITLPHHTEVTEVCAVDPLPV
ncbi:response regulator [Hydrogenophaga sp.]|uniref:response regulator n=1 Tax=Hydrogenophaga sp. TaxID=1904254 RepID=UPI0035B4033C